MNFPPLPVPTPRPIGRAAVTAPATARRPAAARRASGPAPAAACAWALRAAADLSGYPDASAVSAFAQDAVAWAVDAGLLTGTGAGTLNPQGTATRAELAALLVRAEALFTAE